MKWARDMNKQYTEKEIQVALKCGKMYSIFLMIK